MDVHLELRLVELMEVLSVDQWVRLMVVEWADRTEIQRESQTEHLKVELREYEKGN